MIAHHSAVMHAGAGHGALGKGIADAVVMAPQCRHAAAQRIGSIQKTGRLAFAMGRTGKGGVDRLGMLLFEITNLAAVAVAVAADGETVADTGGRILLPDPFFAAGFQHIEGGAVHDQESVVVVKIVVVAAVTALSVLLQQLRDAADRFPGRTAALQCQAEKIHAGESGFAIGAFGEHRFVADAQAELVDADLRTPHPRRAGEQHCVRL